MSEAIGMIEVEGVAGIVVGADAACKAAGVELMGWESIGGFTTLFLRGPLGDVSTALREGEAAAGTVSGHVVGACLEQPRPECAGFVGCALSEGEVEPTALGLIETRGYGVHVEVNDAMVKAADVAVANVLTVHDRVVCTLVTGSGGRRGAGHPPRPGATGRQRVVHGGGRDPSASSVGAEGLRPLPSDPGGKLMESALAILEVRGMTALAAALDSMHKAASVRLAGRHGVGSGWLTAVVEGTTADARRALDAGREAASAHGEVITAAVVPGADPAALEAMPHHGPPLEPRAGLEAIGLLETRGLVPWRPAPTPWSRPPASRSTAGPSSAAPWCTPRSPARWGPWRRPWRPGSGRPGGRASSTAPWCCPSRSRRWAPCCPPGRRRTPPVRGRPRQSSRPPVTPARWPPATAW